MTAAKKTPTGQALNGTNPAFMMNDPSPAGVISVDRSGKDWWEAKTPWLIARTYNGPILIRGARIDEPGAVRFAYGYGQHLQQARFATGADAELPQNRDQWRLLPLASLFPTKGCYAFQVDGTTFSHVITMRVV